MSLREWLIVIGALVILGVVIDGIRRMRRARLDSWEISQGMGGGDIGHSPVDDDYNPELPTGGARVVSTGSHSEPAREMEAPEEPLVPEEPAWDAKPARAVEEPPVSETPEWEPATAEESPVQDTPPIEDGDAVADDDGIVGDVRVRSADSMEPEREKPAAPADNGLTAEREDWAEPQPTAEEGSSNTFSARAIWQRIRDGATGTQGGSDHEQAEAPPGGAWDRGGAETSAPEEQPAAGANRPEAKEVIVINVHCRSEEEHFAGPQLRKLLEACGMEYGDLGIYHRHEEPDTRTPVQFSAANAVAPGTFHPEEMEQLQTPGISFFMSLPGPTDSIQAFDFMMETAQTVVRNLGGELKDENRSVMTAQTIEHCRQRIREFERKQRFVRN